jgi:pimeloyl-ACP methyl ester carboxylesterase
VLARCRGPEEFSSILLPGDWFFGRTNFQKKRIAKLAKMNQRILKIDDDSFAIYTTPTVLNPASPLFILHHGGGHCASVWTKCITELHKLNPNCSILAYDSRSHGSFAILNTPGLSNCIDESDLSLSRLSQDLVSIVQSTYDGSPPSQIILVGHSLGGAVVVDVAKRRLLPKILGVCVIDVVEGISLFLTIFRHSY